MSKVFKDYSPRTDCLMPCNHKETTQPLHSFKLLTTAVTCLAILMDDHKAHKISVPATHKGKQSSTATMTIPHEKFVLCVDDDIDDRLIISEAIKDADPSLVVLEAKDGIEARAFLEKAKTAGKFPCLIILDINMPLMDGKETLKEIMKDEILKRLRVVFFSTSSNPRDRSFSNEYGVDFVTKPPNYRSMVTTIKSMLSRCADYTAYP